MAGPGALVAGHGRDDAVELLDGALRLVSSVKPHEAHALRQTCRVTARATHSNRRQTRQFLTLRQTQNRCRRRTYPGGGAVTIPTVSIPTGYHSDNLSSSNDSTISLNGWNSFCPAFLLLCLASGLYLFFCGFLWDQLSQHLPDRVVTQIICKIGRI